MKYWTEKMQSKAGYPKVVALPAAAAVKMGGKTMVVPTPQNVYDLMIRIPKSRVITVSELRIALARRHKADVACPLTTGIFIWIAANYADEIKKSFLFGALYARKESWSANIRAALCGKKHCLKRKK